MIVAFLVCLSISGHKTENGGNKITKVAVTSHLAKSLRLACLPTASVTQPDSSRKQRHNVNFYHVQSPTCKKGLGFNVGHS